MILLDTAHLDIDTQRRKLKEEVDEFLSASKKEDLSNLVEEYFDVIQVMNSILDKKGCVHMLPLGELNHKLKLSCRGWKMQEVDPGIIINKCIYDSLESDPF